jgi:hypothetical protein
MKRIFPMLLCAALLAATAPASAQVPPQGKVQRVGHGHAPICASEGADIACVVARFYACAASRDAALCAQLGLAEIPKLVETPQTVEFAIERTSAIEAKDVTDDLKHLPWFRPGYLLVEAQARRCPADGSCQAEEWDDWQIYIRRDETTAQIVYWRGDSEPDQPPEIPDSFRAPAPAPAE